MKVFQVYPEKYFILLTYIGSLRYFINILDRWVGYVSAARTFRLWSRGTRPCKRIICAYCKKSPRKEPPFEWTTWLQRGLHCGRSWAKFIPAIILYITFYMYGDMGTLKSLVKRIVLTR